MQSGLFGFAPLPAFSQSPPSAGPQCFPRWLRATHYINVDTVLLVATKEAAG